MTGTTEGQMLTATVATAETMTAREIATAIGVGTRTRDYVMRDREGYTILGQYDTPRYARVLHSLGRSDCSDVTFRIRIVAIALHKSISTGRMHAVSSTRIQAYTPYQLCKIVARIASEYPHDLVTIGDVCDGWLKENHARL
ncbi:hypothetical protein ACFFMN_23395 [Planobispora siamensis]|uniref:Uncharacterized protein n=1 Tax=Planobispora siamensis TaxID=936338 RepID=A0A8J3SL86_9ACTN|nr:hypothetical protein [Planobispora siamensis]GIH95309.1 hypothetical protein Psi01_59390 [Planobispora siamensis]